MNGTLALDGFLIFCHGGFVRSSEGTYLDLHTRGSCVCTGSLGRPRARAPVHRSTTMDRMRLWLTISLLLNALALCFYRAVAHSSSVVHTAPTLRGGARPVPVPELSESAAQELVRLLELQQQAKLGGINASVERRSADASADAHSGRRGTRRRSSSSATVVR